MTALILAVLIVRDATPQATVRAFVDAFAARDSAAIARRVVDGKNFNLGVKFLPKWSLTIGVTKINADEATVETESDIPDLKPRSHVHETVHLRRIQGDWRIVPASPSDDQQPLRPFAQLAMVSAHPELATLPRPASKKTVDLSKIKQVALATILYAADHKDRLPTAKGFKAAVYPYVQDADVFTAPGAPKGTVSYFLDPRLSGMRTTAIANPAETAMILEGSPAKTAFPWAGKTPVGYVDGHAELVDATMVFRARTIKLK